MTSITPAATREEWLHRFIDAARPEFERVGVPIPAKVRASIGFTSTGLRGKSIGECWSKSSCPDEVSEIFLKPSLCKDIRKLAGVLTHELIHAAVGHEAGHGHGFRKPALALGLQGKMTATTEGPDYHAWADPILDRIGPFPGAELVATRAHKKQTTRQLKLSCTECDWICRASNTQIEKRGTLVCPDPLCNGELERA